MSLVGPLDDKPRWFHDVAKAALVAAATAMGTALVNLGVEWVKTRSKKPPTETDS